MPTGNCAWFVYGLCTACVIGVRAPESWERVPSYLVDLELL
jgi:predicted phosphoadenosine phosphosulfate sulfurtransferase